MNKKIQQTFSKKWKLDESVVETIYIIIGQQFRHYGKVSRFLKGLNIQLSARQLKYFYHRVNMSEWLNEDNMGRPKNYSELLRSEKLHLE